MRDKNVNWLDQRIELLVRRVKEIEKALRYYHLLNDDPKTMNIHLHNDAIRYRNMLNNGHVTVECVPDDIMREIRRQVKEERQKQDNICLECYKRGMT